MIEIYEVFPAVKVSGLTSLIVKSEYNPDVVNALKALPLAYYHKKSQM